MHTQRTTHIFCIFLNLCQRAGCADISIGFPEDCLFGALGQNPHPAVTKLRREFREVFRIESARNLIFLKGPLPGYKARLRPKNGEKKGDVNKLQVMVVIHFCSA